MTNTADYAGGLFLYLLLLGGVVVGNAWIFFASFNVGCYGSGCDYALAGAAVQIMFWGSLTTIAASLLFTAVRRDNPASSTWWIPLAGLGVVLALFMIALSLAAAAIEQPFPRWA
jgi:hypothetical protein